MMARVLLVSRSGYYIWLGNREVISWRMQQREAIDALVKAAFVAGKGRYGAERIFYDLAEQDNPLDIKTINKSLKRQGLVAKTAKLFKVTTDSDHALPVAPNLLARDFSAQRPNEKWVTDITYIQTTEGWLYLAVMIDLYSRKVVGWSMSKNIDAQLVCDALMMALWRRKFPQGVFVHSDRGSQYASRAFRDLLEKYSRTQSMSRKGDCWDNACAESFFHSLKVELIHGEPLQNGKQTRESIF
jgi:transposase InsO family protein